MSVSTDPVFVEPDWIYTTMEGHAGGLLGTGVGTYYAKTSSTFICSGAIAAYYGIESSISVPVN